MRFRKHKWFMGSARLSSACDELRSLRLRERSVETREENVGRICVPEEGTPLAERRAPWLGNYLEVSKTCT